MNLYKAYIEKQTSESLANKYRRMLVTIASLAIILAFQIIDKSVNAYTLLIVFAMLIYIKNDIEKMAIIKKIRAR